MGKAKEKDKKILQKKEIRNNGSKFVRRIEETEKKR